jgi:arabinofuranosyltransferase
LTATLAERLSSVFGRRSGSRTPLVIALTAVHAVIACALFHTVRFDDSFIMFRYGQNLAEGRGLVFNPGERVWGSTSVCWVFLSALVHRLAGHDLVPSVMACIGCVAWSAACALVWEILKPTGRPWLAATAAIAIGVGMAGTFCWVGMETCFVSALGLGALLAALRSRFITAAVLAGFAVLTRPDAAALAVLVAFLAVRSQRWRAWRPAVAFAAVIAPWYLYQLVHFGHVIAQSMAAKRGISSLPQYARYVVQIVPAELCGLPPPAAYVVMALIWGLVAYGAVATVRWDSRLWVLPAWLAMQIAGCLAWRPLVHQTWHLYPALLLSVVLVVAGVLALGERFASAQLFGKVAIPAMLATLLGMSLLRSASFAAYDQHLFFWYGARHAAYVDAALIMKRTAQPGDAAAAGEVGTLAYYSGVPVHDWNGIVTPRWRTMVRNLAAGKPGNIRWVVGWAWSDAMVFRASLEGHEPRVYRFPDQRKMIYLFDLHATAPPE